MFRPPRGMRDYPPELARRQNFILEKLREVFERYGFVPLITPAVESFELLSAKGGLGEGVKDEIYYFKDKAARQLGLRFDLTMGLVRFVLSNPNLPKPFKRWQIGRAWRYDEPQALRYREFWQADVDIVGSPSPLADAECLALAADCMKELGFEDFYIRLNNRKLSEYVLRKIGIAKVLDAFRSIDKLDKIGKESVRKELCEKGFEKFVDEIMDFISLFGGPEILAQVESKYGKNEGLEQLKELYSACKAFEIERWIKFDMSLVRGLDYYTGNVFELMIGKKKVTFAAGGRYDNLISDLGGPSSPAVGISFGVARILDEAIKEGLGVPARTRVFVACATDDVREVALKLAQSLRKHVATDFDLLERKLSKQLEYAHKSGANYVVIVGRRELEQNKYKLKCMETGQEEILSLDQIIEKLTK